MTLRFDDRVAIVTGAGRGLGRAYALALAARGAKVVVNDLAPGGGGGTGDGADSDAAAGVAGEVVAGEVVAGEVVAAIEADGGHGVASSHDVTIEAEAHEIVETALSAFGRVDIVINNAGISGGRSFEAPLEEFRAIVDTNVYGSVHVTRAAWPHLRRQGYGRVVMTTSAVGMWGAPASTAYATAKAGVIGLGRALAAEGAAAGILVNCVAPAAETRLTRARFPKPGSRRWRPELVAPMVLYLAHEACELSGEVFSAFAGHFSRVQIVQGPGHNFDARGEVDVDDVVAHLDALTSMEGARSFANGHLDALGTPLGRDLDQMAT